MANHHLFFCIERIIGIGWKEIMGQFSYHHDVWGGACNNRYSPIFLYLHLIYQREATMTSSITLRSLTAQDIPMMVEQFAAHDWPKPSSTFERYLFEQESGMRLVWLGFYEKQFAGYVTLTLQSLYEPFRTKYTPEIMDLNVLPPYRNKGIGSLLIETAEQEAFMRNNTVSIGVGLYAGYGNAQKLYIARGYQPDGLGVTYTHL